jgi:hypothetical protein
MRGTVTIYWSQRQGAGYEISVLSSSGRVTSSIRAGYGAGNAAAMAVDYIARHCVENDAGGDAVGDADVMALIPKHLHSVPARANRKGWAE